MNVTEPIMRRDWESLVSAGLELTQAMDTNRWGLGALAEEVWITYETLADIDRYASAINLPAKKTLYGYWKVSRFYNYSPYADLPMLNWSHYREAMRAGELAYDWLTQASDNNWPVAKLAEELDRYLGKKGAPKKLLDMKAYVVGLNPDVLTLKIDRAIHDALVQARAIGDVRLVLYEVE